MKHRPPELNRFLLFLDARPSDGSCWEWRGGKFRLHGKWAYGCFVNGRGKAEGAHRAAYRLFVGPIPSGKCVLHSCDNPACVLPEHLRVGTKADNSKDRDSRRRGCYPGDPRHPQTKLTPRMIAAIRREAVALAERRGSRYGVLAILAERFPVTSSYLSKVCTGLMDHLPRYKVSGLGYPNPNPHARKNGKGTTGNER